MTTFKRNLSIGYGISIILLLITAIASYISINNLIRTNDLIDHTNDIKTKVDSVISVLKDAETGQRGFLLTEDERFLEPYNGSFDKANRLLNDIKLLTADNPQQQVDCNHLSLVIKSRLSSLAARIEMKRKGISVTDSMLYIGKFYMDSARSIVKQMQQRETQILADRTETQKKFAASTPLLIVIASLLSLIVTVVSFLRLIKDFNAKATLQQELAKKDEETSQRLSLIDGIATKVSEGDYTIRIDDERKDSLGGIAISLNKMTASLQNSFTTLSHNEWLQKGIASLNDIMIADQTINTLATNVLNFVVDYTKSQAGAFYIAHEQKELHLISSYALNTDKNHEVLQFGQSLAGQAAQTGKILTINIADEKDYVISFAAGNIKPKSIVAIPVIYNGTIKGVIELASLEHYTDIIKEYFKNISFNTGIALNTSQDRQRVQELLEKTKAQSEELKTQHSELENINAELEAQAERLQTSEEELKVQQEELQQANQELEERSRLLEEKNELVLERNLEIQAKAEELELSTKYKSEFLANMSHELRTPLNSILLLSRLLSENHESNLSKDQIEYANVIQSSGKGLLTLIDEILDLSKIEAGKMDLEYSNVQTDDLINELKALFSPVARDKNIEFTIKKEKGTPDFIETDRLRLEQIIRNLISNALKFTKKGSVNVAISKQSETFVVEVKDTGIGIPQSKQATIFEAFQQADGSTKRQFGGTGLGLSISKQLAKLLNGEIKLQSEENKGSVFTLIIPLKKEDAVHSQETIIEQTQTIQVDTSKKIKDSFLSDVIPLPVTDDRNKLQKNDRVILIIEDDTSFAKSLLEYTRSKGYKGVVAVRGDEGITLAQQLLPVGILLDIQLPIKNGWQVMDELKANPKTRPIPVHMMSSHEAKTKSLSKGAVDFINKPVAFEKLGEIFSKIENALSRHPKKVLIVEENSKHAEALSYFLQNYSVASEIKTTVDDGIKALQSKEVDCVILDMGISAQQSYDTLDEVKKIPGLENIPIIIFTGRNLSHTEEMKIKQYADSIVIKTAHSYQRILDEVSLFLHIVEENKKESKPAKYKKMGELSEVLKEKTALIADDDIRNIFSLTKSLENYGMNVLSAIDGKDALEQLQKNKVDIVLMDMMMPEMDGYETTKRIRGIAEFKNLPIIAVTAKAMTGDREKCIAAGASDYITKPVDVDQLMSLLRVWLYE